VKHAGYFFNWTAKDNQPIIKPMMRDTKVCADEESAALTGSIKWTANAMLATMPMKPANLEMVSLTS